MTGTLYVNLHCNNGEIVMVSKKKFEIYDDEWDMLAELQRNYGCLPWKENENRSWSFVADIENADGSCVCFVAEFRPLNNQ